MKHIVPIMGLIAALGVGAFAQEVPTSEERLRALEVQNREILERLQRSESRNVELEGEVQTLRASHDTLRLEQDSAELERSVNTLRSRVLDGVTFKDLTKSGNPIKFYGFLRTDIYWNSARMNSVILPQFVLPENDVAAEDANDDEFSFDVRLTRFAFDLNAGKIGSADVTGKLETDFANLPPVESRPTPRIRLAYITMDFGDVAIRLGQDWDIIGPLFPAVNGETLMWNAGNVGDRRPMAQLFWNAGDPAGTEFELRLGAGLTGAVDGQDLDAGAGVARPFTSTITDGTDSGHPHGQIRLGLAFPSWVEGKRVQFGLFGYLAGLETDTEFANDDHFTSWLVGADWQLPLFGIVGLRGEFFLGQALADVRGGIAQSINTATGEEIDTVGGWAELTFQFTDTFKMAGGATIDNVDNEDIGAGARGLNWSMYLASTLSWGGGLKSGLDVIFWETDWKDTGIGNTVRVNFYTQLDF